MSSHRVMLLTLGLCVATVAQAQLQWHSIGSPASRRSATMVVDSANQRIVLFGGVGEECYNDVWEIPLGDSNHLTWLSIPIQGLAPVPRYWHCSAYDARHQKMYVFSGVDGGMPFNDVWALDLTLGKEKWQQLAPGNVPNPIHGASDAVYDAARNSLLVFGGWDGNTTWFNDLWELKLDSMVWRKIAVSGPAPGPRSSCGIWMDYERSRLMIFGGASTSDYYNDVWSLDLIPGSEHWTLLAAAGSPPSQRTCFADGYDARNDEFYVFGGHDASGNAFNDAYRLSINGDSLMWTELNATGDPPSDRSSVAGTFDPFDGDLFVFGGCGYSGYDNDAYFLPMGPTGVHEWQAQPSRAQSASVFVPSVSNGTVRLRYVLPEPVDMTVKIMDISGRLVRSVFSGRPQSSSGWLTWDGRNEDGRQASAGAYICLLETGSAQVTGQKFVLVR